MGIISDQPAPSAAAAEIRRQTCEFMLSVLASGPTEHDWELVIQHAHGCADCSPTLVELIKGRRVS